MTMRQLISYGLLAAGVAAGLAFSREPTSAQAPPVSLDKDDLGGVPTTCRCSLRTATRRAR